MKQKYIYNKDKKEWGYWDIQEPCYCACFDSEGNREGGRCIAHAEANIEPLIAEDKAFHYFGVKAGTKVWKSKSWDMALDSFVTAIQKYNDKERQNHIEKLKNE